MAWLYFETEETEIVLSYFYFRILLYFVIAVIFHSIQFYSVMKILHNAKVGLTNLSSTFLRIWRTKGFLCESFGRIFLLILYVFFGLLRIVAIFQRFFHPFIVFISLKLSKFDKTLNVDIIFTSFDINEILRDSAFSRLFWVYVTQMPLKQQGHMSENCMRCNAVRRWVGCFANARMHACIACIRESAALLLLPGALCFCRIEIVLSRSFDSFWKFRRRRIRFFSNGRFRFKSFNWWIFPTVPYCLHLWKWRVQYVHV